MGAVHFRNNHTQLCAELGEQVKLLPALGAYLGQVGLVSMNRHLSLTPEHYRKYLAAVSGRRDSRKRDNKTNALTAEFLRRIKNS